MLYPTELHAQNGLQPHDPAAEQLDSLQQIGFPLPVATDHQQARRLKRQIQSAVIAELAQLQAGEPNRSWAV